MSKYKDVFDDNGNIIDSKILDARPLSKKYPFILSIKITQNQCYLYNLKTKQRVGIIYARDDSVEFLKYGFLFIQMEDKRKGYLSVEDGNIYWLDDDAKYWTEECKLMGQRYFENLKFIKLMEEV